MQAGQESTKTIKYLPDHSASKDFSSTLHAFQLLRFASLEIRRVRTTPAIKLPMAA
jgi:hypothetical protein